jgi:hypothetical protein
MNEATRNPDADLDALFALARARRPDTSKAEFAFETRLMARLHSHHDNGSMLAMVAWRLIPFFGAGVAALFLWQAEVTTEATDAAGIAGLQNPETVDLWTSLN